MGDFKYNEPEAVRVPKLNDLLPLTGGTITDNLAITGTLSVTGAVTGASFNGVYLRAPDSTSIGVGGSTVLSGAASGNRNTGLGSGAGASVTSGFRNTLIGYNSGDAITTGSNNVSIGDVALSACVTGTDNVAIGHDAGRVVTGSSNTILGSDAGDGLTSGGSNTFVGFNTGIGVTTGGNNTIVGANVTGLAAGTANNVILADGAGTKRFHWDGTNNTITGDLNVVGNITQNGADVDPWTYIELGADFSTTNSAAQNITGMAFTPAANTSYEFEAFLLLRTSDAAAAAQPGVSWPTGGSDGAVSIYVATGSGGEQSNHGSISSAVRSTASTMVILSSQPGKIKGLFIAGATPSGDVQLTLESDDGAATVTVKAGSFLKYRAL